MNPRHLQRLAARWRWQLGARDGLFAFGAAGVVGALTIPWTGAWPWLAAAAFVATLALKLPFSRFWMLDSSRVVEHLDRTYPDLEESSALWLRAPASLTLLERLQLQRIDTAVAWVIPDDPPPGAPPRGFLKAAAWYGLGGIILCGATGLWTCAHGTQRGRASAPVQARHLTTPANPPPAPRVWPRLVRSALAIVPPAYTGRPARQVDVLSTEVAAGSDVTWTLGLDRPVRSARLVFGAGGGSDLALEPAGAGGLGLTARRTVLDTGLYHLAAVLPDGTEWNPPEVYSLKVIADGPPTLRVLAPAEGRTIIEPSSPPPRVDVEVLAGDDYGLGEAHLVATVAKGSGESVKFREQTLAFDTDEPAGAAAPHGRRLRRALDLGALGMEPGDELYFFVEAHDNRQPIPNRTRSETRFLVLRGPQERAAAAGRGVAGVNLVPVYFRSERQIIIDTEKLLADRPTIADHDYRARASDLGLDQQLLRLRYGQFLGEELEGSAVTDHAEVNLNPLQAAPREATGPHAAASIAQRFEQEHIEQDREGGGADGPAGLRAAPGKPLSSDEVRKPFVDSHDTQDAATLFDRQTKGTLKDVIAAMWEAEGDLRTDRVPDALAPEHRALDILKDLQQSARAYVQHVGFEPEPLKIAERRLKGDAAGAPGLGSERDVLPAPDADAGTVRAALGVVAWDAPPAAWPPDSLDALRNVEPALTKAATQRPDVFLEGLQVLRRLRAGGGAIDPGTLRPLERALWRLLPSATPLPQRVPDRDPALADAYHRALQKAEDAQP